MDKLKNQLLSGLLENSAIQIKKSVLWHLPVMTYKVGFKRIKRSKMDILMKMMLLTFEQAEIRRAANLAELLLVEELFIADLLKKLQRMGLITLEKDCYKLTTKGQVQLKTGIIAEELEEEWTMLTYSTVHGEFWTEMTQPIPEVKEELPLFRYANYQDPITAQRILPVLEQSENELEENGFQTVVDEVTSFEQQTVEPVPCLEFQLYNKEQDIFYVRVWNTWLQRWDVTLEKQIEEKERLEWREKWGVDEGDAE
jgi:hypothetical protein